MTAWLARIKHYFFPHPGNNHRARILHPGFLSLLVAVFLTSQFALNSVAVFFPRVLGFAADIAPEKIIELTNRERAQNGLPPLVNNPVLNQAAQQKAGDMFALNYWAHNSPAGRTPWTFFKEAGYHYSFAGENLARDFNDSTGVLAGWMGSPTHRDNILNDAYQEIGVAVVNGTLEGVETTLVVQLFGTPTTAVGKELVQGEQFFSVPEPALASGEATSAAWLSGLAEAAGMEKDTGAKPLANFFSVTKLMVIFGLGIVIGALVLDLVLIARRKVVRLSGRSLAHLTFLLFLLLAVLSLQPGMIL